MAYYEIKYGNSHKTEKRTAIEIMIQLCISMKMFLWHIKFFKNGILQNGTMSEMLKIVLYVVYGVRTYLCATEKL